MILNCCRTNPAETSDKVYDPGFISFITEFTNSADKVYNTNIVHKPLFLSKFGNDPPEILF